MDVASSSSASPAPSTSTPKPTLDWATQYVAQMTDQQRALLQKMYAQEQERKRKEKEKKEQEELAKQQQQAILDSLTSQVPITVDVVRSSTPPDSQKGGDSASSSSSPVGSTEEEEEIQLTVKDVVLGKFKASQIAARAAPKPYKPHRSRMTRDRVFYESHVYIFDKSSYDNKKKFYRCEKKNTCPARLHIPSDSYRVIFMTQEHNHPAPSVDHWEIDFEKVRTGCVYPLIQQNPLQGFQASSLLPTSMLTPKSDFEEDTPERVATPSPMDILNRMVLQLDQRKPFSLRLPDNFKPLGEAELSKIDMALTKYLLIHNELREELMAKKHEIPTFFPEAKREELRMFVADYCRQDAEFHMLKVEGRNEKSIRTAIESHLNQTSTKALMMSVSPKINVPLSQQMIDDWKTEEFIRLDSSKPNHWKIHHVTKLDH
ncbi:hypothetical protein L5515_010582 [Caenorhabditis briggsae]|uniref:FLYWCH-type domain-containing protein n=1 Tax=Caenorhabditis briggsae TaxID=6238 RepID=A0AAE9EV03_CAEBR|nr:hypothetical protein L5515_010582 [Caenorhabditis briggsae]